MNEKLEKQAADVTGDMYEEREKTGENGGGKEEFSCIRKAFHII